MGEIQGKKKVLFIMLSLTNGGAEKSLINLLNAWKYEQCEVDLMLFRQSGLFLQQVPKQVRIVNAPKEVFELYNTSSCKGVRKIVVYVYKIIAKIISYTFEFGEYARTAYRWEHFYSKSISPVTGMYDAVFAYMHGEPIYFAVDKVANAKKKMVWVHTDYNRFKNGKKYDQKYFEQADKIVTISDICAQTLKETFPALTQKILSLPNITSSDLISKRASEFYPNEYVGFKSTIIVSVGRLSEEKGFDIAVDAAAILKERNIDFKWFLVGNGKLKEALQTRIKELNIQDIFILVGEKENPYPYIKNSTIFVQPSRFEGKSMVLDEAKILAKPIVSTNYPTVRDQLPEQEDGLVVEIDAESLADGIIKLIADIELRNKMIEHHSSQKYGNESEIINYMNLI